MSKVIVFCILFPLFWWFWNWCFRVLLVKAIAKAVDNIKSKVGQALNELGGKK